MPWKLPRPRFGLRTLLVVVLACAVGLAFWTSPGRWRTYRNQQARQRIDPYELSIAGDGNPRNVPPELVAILGDSRLKHWFGIGQPLLLPGNRVVSTDIDETARVWSMETGRQQRLFEAICIEPSGDRSRLFVGTRNGKVTCYDTSNWKALQAFPVAADSNYLHLASNIDGSALLTETVMRDRSREIVVWDASNSKGRFRFDPGPSDMGGALLLNHDAGLFTWKKNSAIQVSRTDTGEVVREIGPIVHMDSKCSIGKLVLTPDESQLFVSAAPTQIVIFDWQSGKELERIPEGSGGQFTLRLDQKSLLGFQGVIYRPGESGWKRSGSISSPSGNSPSDWFGKQLAGSSRNGIVFWHGAPQFNVWRLQGGPTRMIQRVAFRPGGKDLFVGDSGGEISVYATGTWQLTRRWLGHEHPVESLSFAANGSKLVTSAEDGIGIWNPANGEEEKSIRNVWQNQFVALSPDGLTLAGNTERMIGNAFELRQVHSGESIKKIGPLAISICGPPRWSPDGKTLVCNDAHSELHAFDVRSGTLIGTLGKSPFGQKQLCSVWLSDSKRLITAGWGRDEVHLLEIGKTTPNMTINAGGGQVKWVALHPSEKWIATCGYKTPVQIWHLPTAKLVKSWQIGPIKGTVNQVEFSPDGNYLATVNGNGTAYILSLDGILVE